MSVFLVYRGHAGDDGYISRLFSSREKAEAFVTKAMWPSMSPATEEPDKSRGLYLGSDGRVTHWARIDAEELDKP